MLRAVSILRSLPSAISSLSLLDEELKGSHIIAACTCVMQAVFLEVYLGGTSQWTGCLKQAAPYMHALIDLVCSEKESTSPSKTTKHTVHQVQKASAKALLGQMVWFDIIGLVSTGHGPSLGTNHSFLLDSDVFDLKETSGCENWVAKSLYEIHDLRTWKAKEVDAQRLCVIKLAERGGTILEILKKQIVTTEEGLRSDTETPQGMNDEGSSVFEPLEQNLKTITMAYATAAVIYLHVIVSGPTPLLEDIRRETPRLVEHLKVLASRGLLCHVSFPLCVASCFMEDHDLDFFKGFVPTDRHSRPWRFETCDRAIMIAQECRKRRGDGRRCDWIDVTQESDWKFLLV
ncbi:hypothetical protein LZ32DRAFT_436473 [Colletotrichum eremochloae]|nr:hypothetical protein LZ32DRAFT_436473 [Colletotrichum eremochloae]